MRATAPAFDATRQTGHGTAGLARKPIQRATSSNGSESHIAQRPKQGRKVGHPIENRKYVCGIRLAANDREVIVRQLFRCIGKYDPRAIPRIISKRTGITEQAVDYVFQLTICQYEIWTREFKLALARADEAAAAVWTKRSA